MTARDQINALTSLVDLLRAYDRAEAERERLQRHIMLLEADITETGERADAWKAEAIRLRTELRRLSNATDKKVLVSSPSCKSRRV